MMDERPNYKITLTISDDGLWPRIKPESLWQHIDLKLPTGLELESVVVRSKVGTIETKVK